MRKLFLLAVGLAMTLTACQKDEGLVSDGATSQTITVTIPQGMQTRATAADFGNGAKIDRCLLQIYHSGTTPAKYGEQQSATVQKGADGKLTATFNLRLVAQQTYDFVFWADCSTGDHYNTDDLTNITVKGNYAGNNDEFDAFTGALLDYQVKGAFSENITLRRPFGQLNVKTLDMAAIPDPTLKPTKVKVAFTAVPTSFNAKKGEIGAATAAVEYTADVLSADGDLTVDYIWAPVEEATLADFSMTFLNGTTEISTNGDFKNIPIRRNYRTNVSGNLLTKQGTFNVTIDPEFYKPDITVVTTAEELHAAFANGGSVTLSEDVTVEAPLVVETGKTVEIDLNGKDIINTTSLPDTDPRYGNTTVFEVKGGATLNIKGDGNIKAIGTKPNEDGYRMAVYAYGDAKVNIYGGNFVNDQDYNDHNAQLDLIYADQQAVINIYGGTFESKSANNRGYWVLNLKDGSGAAINVYGGTFINYDPSSSMTENPVKNFVAEGYTAIKTSAEPAPNGTYTVVKGTEVAAPADLESALKSGDIAIVSRSMTIDDSPYISSVASATLSLKEGAVLTAQEGSELQQCIQVSKSCKKMVISGKGFIVGPKNSTATNVAGIYSGCPDLVIDGTITVDGSSGSKGTNAAIRIAEGTTTIKDGYFTVGTDASGIANSCILVATARPSQKAHLKIYGGVFETKGNPINGWYPVINIQDADRKAGRATVEIYGGIFINYNPATGDNTGEADDTFVAPGYKSVETTYNGQQAWQVIPE
ncbi:DUF6562 domain-containing protein [Alistipes putredinis]|uniref:DUF6562 domain-containing protein n=2 Tax=Alistipes putredinis TaxID=28117 RepID=UPI002667106C|nr:DUF6562 domain-containing protein [Alistipes putredinis]